ncbi:hypothetical protein containing ferritin domain 1 [Thermococcus cleftensis]|uniref:DUF2202 domain-containing protein n=1 Tax=Thermococcus cleftensis (strain DSM 27260 / KACC 17922 / CL1) TaxID=163003 RepID=I3ZRX1_THECF|nr:DUF2202 domain-containing protein [Thermococcus cleftensis]AFL94455.1 hypothetical protein containing ferritin domain 1 [Thermococcus cleftensis]
MKKLGILVAGLLLLAVLGAGCITGDSTMETTTVSPSGGPPEDRGYGGIPGEGYSEVPNVSAMPYQELSQDEIDAILYMREEEKLARDVYLVLYNKTGLPVFQNIAKSEQTHMDMVLSLIEKYNLTDPVEGMGVGEFKSTEMQNLYEELVSKGSVNEVEALKVGALIEEIDIKDLEEWLKRTDNEDVKAVFESLMAGSENHLRAFTRLLENRYDVTYSPQVLSQEEYLSIVGR